MEDRFQIRYKQRSWELDAQVVEDTQTGVQYLVLKNGNQIAAVTPLLDESGRVTIAGQERERQA